MWKVSELLIAAILASLAVVDVHYRKIPLDILVLATAAALINQIFIEKGDPLLIFGGVGVGITFLWISRLTKEGVGYGDSLAILILGICLGLWRVLAVLAITFLILGIVAMGCLVWKKMSRKKTLPFYPFLMCGYIICICAEKI